MPPSAKWLLNSASPGRSRYKIRHHSLGSPPFQSISIHESTLLGYVCSANFNRTHILTTSSHLNILPKDPVRLLTAPMKSKHNCLQGNRWADQEPRSGPSWFGSVERVSALPGRRAAARLKVRWTVWTGKPGCHDQLHMSTWVTLGKWPTFWTGVSNTSMHLMGWLCGGVDWDSVVGAQEVSALPLQQQKCHSNQSDYLRLPASSMVKGSCSVGISCVNELFSL